MDEKKENSLQNFIKNIKPCDSLNKAIESFYALKNLFNHQRIFQSIQESYKIFDEVVKELEEQNINPAILGNLLLSEIIKLYYSSNKSGLAFADLAEDNLKLFGHLEYKQAETYLELLNSRKNQVLKNDIKSINYQEDLLEDLQHIEGDMASYIKLRLKSYGKGEIRLSEREKKVLKEIKQNRYISNKNLAKTLNYSVRNIETICANIRKKFEIDFIEDKKTKRELLVSLGAVKHLKQVLCSIKTL